MLEPVRTETRRERRKGLGTQARIGALEDDVDDVLRYMDAIHRRLGYLLSTCVGILVSLVSTLAVELLRIH